jgi:hypothetical protein
METEMRIPSQQKKVDSGELVPVLTGPGRTVRGSTYYQEVELLLSTELAKYLIAEGDVKPSDR